MITHLQFLADERLCWTAWYQCKGRKDALRMIWDSVNDESQTEIKPPYISAMTIPSFYKVEYYFPAAIVLTKAIEHNPYWAQPHHVPVLHTWDMCSAPRELKSIKRDDTLNIRNACNLKSKSVETSSAGLKLSGSK